MNLENFKKVRDQIAMMEDKNFSMASFADVIKDETGYQCGTVMCIAGWAASMLEDVVISVDIDIVSFRENDVLVSPDLLGAKFLGLTILERDFVFYGDWSDTRHLPDITKEETVAYLDRVIGTGSVFA